MSRAERLMVLVPDRITEILEKGEYQPNYYNPGELFSDVHIVTTTDDRPDLDRLKRTVGDAPTSGEYRRWIETNYHSRGAA